MPNYIKPQLSSFFTEANLRSYFEEKQRRKKGGGRDHLTPEKFFEREPILKDLKSIGDVYYDIRSNSGNRTMLNLDDYKTVIQLVCLEYISALLSYRIDTFCSDDRFPLAQFALFKFD